MFVTSSVNITKNHVFMLRNVLEEFDSFSTRGISQSDEQTLRLAKIFYYLHSGVSTSVEKDAPDASNMSINFQCLNDAQNEFYPTEQPTNLIESSLALHFLETGTMSGTNMTKTDVKKYLLSKWFSLRACHKTQKSGSLSTNFPYNTLVDESPTCDDKESIRFYKSVPLNPDSTYSILTDMEESDSENLASSSLPVYEKLNNSELFCSPEHNKEVGIKLSADANDFFCPAQNLMNRNVLSTFDDTTNVENLLTFSDDKPTNEKMSLIPPTKNVAAGNSSFRSEGSSSVAHVEEQSDANASVESGSRSSSTSDSSVSSTESDCSSSAENTTESSSESSSESATNDGSSAPSSAESTTDDSVTSLDETESFSSAESTTDLNYSVSSNGCTTDRDDFGSLSTKSASIHDRSLPSSVESITGDDRLVSLSTSSCDDSCDCVSAESTTDEEYLPPAGSTTDDSVSSVSAGSSDYDSVSCLGESARYGDDSLTVSDKGTSHDYSLLSYSGESEADGNSLTYPYDILTNADDSLSSCSESRSCDSFPNSKESDDAKCADISEGMKQMSIRKNSK